MPERLTVASVTGQDLLDIIPELARLRMEVFRAFPYLYHGTHEYEQEYLQTYARAQGMFVAVARTEAGRVVGASTALPLTQETPQVQRPFLSNAEFDVQDILYLGESVLLPEYRGQGTGKVFFDLREAHARALNLNTTTFCAVQRPQPHPAHYRPLNAFWQARGYTERPDLHTPMSWQDVGETQETPKDMRFWVKRVGS